MAKKYIVQLIYKDGTRKLKEFATVRAAANYLDREMDRDSNIRAGDVL